MRKKVFVIDQIILDPIFQRLADRFSALTDKSNFTLAMYISCLASIFCIIAMVPYAVVLGALWDLHVLVGGTIFLCVIMVGSMLYSMAAFDIKAPARSETGAYNVTRTSFVFVRLWVLIGMPSLGFLSGWMPFEIDDYFAYSATAAWFLYVCALYLFSTQPRPGTIGAPLEVGRNRVRVAGTMDVNK